MHPQGKQKIDDYLIQLIDNCNIKDGSVDPFFSPIYELASKIDDIVYKSKSKWVIKGEIRTFIFTSINQKIFVKYSFNKVEGKLSELLDPKTCNELILDISDEIKSIPIVYNVFLELPGFPLINHDSLSISEDFKFIRVTDDSDLPLVTTKSLLGQLTKVGLKKDETYLQLRTKGSVNNNENCKAIQNVLNKIKFFIDIGYGFKVFETAPPTMTLNLLGISHDQQTQFICVAENQSPSVGQLLTLPDPVSNIIPKLKFKDEFYVKDEKIVTLYWRKRYSELKLAELNKFLSLLKKAFTNLDKLIFIQNAIEWSFESRFSNNITFSFILLCLAFESILGEDIPETNSISFTIADRCAYLISKNQLHRKDIRKTFRDLYKLRSKFVHGKKTRLTENDRLLYFWGRDLLDFIIRKELDVVL